MCNNKNIRHLFSLHLYDMYFSVNQSVEFKDTRLNVDDNDVEFLAEKNVYLDPDNYESFPKDSMEMNRKT